MDARLHGHDSAVSFPSSRESNLVHQQLDARLHGHDKAVSNWMPVCTGMTKEHRGHDNLLYAFCAEPSSYSIRSHFAKTFFARNLPS